MPRLSDLPESATSAFVPVTLDHTANTDIADFTLFTIRLRNDDQKVL